MFECLNVALMCSFLQEKEQARQTNVKINDTQEKCSFAFFLNCSRNLTPTICLLKLAWSTEGGEQLCQG